MTTITIPTPIQTTASTICTYINANNTSGIQTLLEDTDFTIEDYQLKYQNIPLFTISSNSTSYLFMCGNKYSRVASTRAIENYFGDSSDKIYIYNFNSFYYIQCLQSIEIKDNTSRVSAIIDKNNKEIFSGFNLYISSKGIPGNIFNHLDEDNNYITSRYFPNDKSTNSNFYRAPEIIREESATNVIYYKLKDIYNNESNRVYFFQTFPRGSSNQVLHIDNKYFYIFPYDETQVSVSYIPFGQTTTTTENREIYCTLGIDITDEINE